MPQQQTLIVIKPDGLVKSLTGNILTRLSETKLEIIAAKMVRVSEELAREHYQHMKDKPFFDELVSYLQGKLHNRRKVLAMVYWGDEAIEKVRNLAGATNPEKADPTSIRGSYGRITSKGVYENVIHTSSNPEEAEREIKLWFEPDEIIQDVYPTKTAVLDKVKKRAWAQI
ncbi:MAG: nucleoside-diphosphate kinase [Candidatus Omnitrophica bacterium]|nr:nucleoside-diphosphate kinase [Candidatus Omnitrophota bacterium]MBU1925340.1 nucleoside-diphosphate kinase [Candidatus Omnitrophota bacterium]